MQIGSADRNSISLQTGRPVDVDPYIFVLELLKTETKNFIPGLNR